MKMRRESSDIKAEVLSFALKRDEVTPTDVFYEARLSGRTYRRYLQQLVKAELLAEKTVGKKRRYHITVKGEEWLRRYKKLKEIEG